MRFIAESVAAPALYDDVCVPIHWLNRACFAVGCNAPPENLCSGCAGNVRSARREKTSLLGRNLFLFLSP